MSVFKLPLSGDVTQWISPITSWWSGNNISINLGESGSAETEAEILRRVGQLGALRYLSPKFLIVEKGRLIAGICFHTMFTSFVSSNNDLHVAMACAV